MVKYMKELSKLKALANQSFKQQATQSDKKIVVGNTHSNLREQFKKTFLPLLIDISELRLMLENYKLQKTSGRIFKMEQMDKSPEQILEKLEDLQSDIEETRRWCEGVISQIARGIDETKELLAFLGGTDNEEATGWKNLFKKK